MAYTNLVTFVTGLLNAGQNVQGWMARKSNSDRQTAMTELSALVASVQAIEDEVPLIGE